MSDRRVGRGLSTSLWFLTLAINVLVTVIQAESPELNSSSIHLAVAWHTNSLFLVQNSSLKARATRRSFSSCLDRRRSISACSRSLSLMLLVSSRDGCSGSTNGALSRVPRVSSGASSCASCRWIRGINNLFKICLGKLVFGWGQSSFRFRGSNGGLDGDSALSHRGSLFFYGLNGFGFGWGGLGYKLSFKISRLRGRNFLGSNRRGFGSG